MNELLNNIVIWALGALWILVQALGFYILKDVRDQLRCIKQTLQSAVERVVAIESEMRNNRQLIDTKLEAMNDRVDEIKGNVEKDIGVLEGRLDRYIEEEAEKCRH